MQLQNIYTNIKCLSNKCETVQYNNSDH
uniref:Uncharacterized protein n=1 Tax=Arundo donax TaxID=35708 RepID=A0A0A9FMR7_ARUDO